MAATKSELSFPSLYPVVPWNRKLPSRVGRFGRNENRVELSQVCTQWCLGIGSCYLETRLLVNADLISGSGAAREITSL